MAAATTRLPASARALRDAARASGESFYDPGVDCNACGTSRRSTRSNNCVECKIRYDNRRNVEQSEAHVRRVREWRAQNREAARALRRRNYEQYLDVALKKLAEYRAKHPDRTRAYRGNCRAKNAGAPVGDRRALLVFMKTVTRADLVPCNWCGRSLERSEREVDHIIPISRGGAHAAGNLCVSCTRCNRRKSSKLPEEFVGQSEMAFT